MSTIESTLTPTRPETPSTNDGSSEPHHTCIRNNRAFPNEVPQALRHSETELKTSSALVGILVGVATSVGAHVLADKQSMLGHMFDLSQPSAAIPVAISCLFYWAIFLCCLRWCRLRELERISGRRLLSDAAQTVCSVGLQNLADDLENPGCPASPLLRRLQSVVRQWSIQPSVQDAHLVLQQHATTDAEAVHSGYSLVRTFVWALPVLGLIGTVIGIALAVGGFAHFLGGNVEDVSVIKQSLVGVTGGLSFAFLITLHGLLTALLTMLLASTLQTREEKLYTNIQQDIVDLFLPVLQRAVPESKAGMASSDRAAFREILQQTAEKVLSTVGDQSARFMEAMESRQAAYREQLNDWSESLRRETGMAAERIGEAVQGIGANLTTASDDFLARLSLVREGLDHQTSSLQMLVKSQTEAASLLQTQVLAGVSEQTKSIHAAAETLSGLEKATMSALERQTALQESLRQFGEEKVEQAFNNFAQALLAQAQETRASTQVAKDVARLTQELLAAQQSLHAGVAQLHDLGLDQTLAEFRDAFVNLGPVLASFRAPFVLQAVPLNSEAVGHHRDRSH